MLIRHLSTGVIFLGVLALVSPADAAVCTWLGSSSANWADSNAWSDADNGPLSGDSLVFGAAGSAGVTLTDNLMTPNSYNVAGITFNSGAPAYTINPAAIGANGFTLTGSVGNNSTSTQTINDAINLNGVQTFTTAASGGNITLGGNISDSSSGTGGITAAGAGILTLASTASYSGPTLISSGTLRVLAPALNFTFASGTDANNGSQAVTVTTGTTSGSVLPSFSSTGGPIAGLGVMALNGSNYLDIKPVSGNLPNLGGNLSSSAYTISMWINTTTSGASLLYKGVIGTWGSNDELFHLGNATSGATSGSPGPGGTDGLGGLVGGVQYAGGWVGSSGTVNNGTWEYVSYVRSGGTTTTYVNGVANGVSTGMANAEQGTQDIRIGYNDGDTGDGAVMFSGSISGVQVYNAALSASQIKALYTGQSPGGLLSTNSPVQLTASGAALDVNGTTQNIASLSGVAGSSVYLGGGTLSVGSAGSSTTFAGAIADSGGASVATGGSLIKIGSGALTLAGANTYTGATSITAGTLNLAGNLTGGGAVTVASGAAFTQASTSLISGATSLASSGATTLAGTSTYTGATTVNGVLSISGSGVISATSTLTVGSISGSAAAMYQSSASTVTNTNTGAGGFAIGGVTGAFGYYNLSGGTINLAGEIDVGSVNGGAGTFAQFDMSGGVVNLPNRAGTYFLPNRGAAGEASVVNILGGTVQIAGSGSAVGADNGIEGLSANWAAGGQKTAITISGSGQFLTPGLYAKLNENGNTGNVASLNLGGAASDGTLQALGFEKSVSAQLNFNGGTLKAGSSGSTTFLTGLGGAFVYASGGTIDNNGVAITIGQALLAPAGAGLVTGVTTIPGGYGSGFAVPPQVTFSGGGGTGATAYTTVSPTTGAVTGIVVTNPGTGYTSAPTVILTASSGSATVPSSIWTPSMVSNTSGGMTFQGSGTTTLSGASTFLGGTTVNAGVLALTSGGAVGTLRGPLTINSGATVDLNAQDALGYGAGTCVTSVNINGGMLVNITSSNNAYITSFTLDGGSMASSGGGSYNFSTGYGIATVASSATSLVSGPIIIRDANTLSFNVTSGTAPGGIDLTVSGKISSQNTNGIAKSGTGLLQLTGANTYTGGTTISGGTVNINADAALGTAPGSPATNLTFAGNSTLQFGANNVSLAASRSIAINGGVTATFDTQGYFASIAGAIADGTGGSGALFKAGSGTLALTGVNSYSGGTTINSGVLNINADAALGTVPFPAATNITFSHNSTLQFGANNLALSANRNIAVNSGATATFDTNGYAVATIAGVISGSGSLATAGSGVLTLLSPNTYSGTTTINSGALLLSASGANLGSLGPTAVSIGANGTLSATGTASIGGSLTTTASGAQINLQNGTIDTLAIGGGLKLANGSVLDLDIGSAAGVNDTIAVAGSVSLTPYSAGTINISEPIIASGNYTLLTAASGGLSPGGDFALGTHPTFRGSYSFNQSTTTALVLSVSAAPYVSTAYWTGHGSQAVSDGSNNWSAGPSTTTNWSTDPAGTNDAEQVPGPITDVVFTASNAIPNFGNALVTQLDANFAIKGLTIAVPAVTGSAQITSTVIKPNGFALTVGGDGLTLAATSLSSATFGSGQILLATSQSWANNNSSLGLMVNSAVAPVSGPTALTFNGTGTGGVVLNGALADNNGKLAVAFNQAGTTQLNGANSFTGGVTISSGTVQLGNAGALNATVPNSVTFGSGSGGVGDLQINGNSVAVSGLYADGSVLPLVENASATAGTLTVNNSLADTYSGVFQDGTGGGSLAVTKAGSGVLALTGSNTYSGGTVVNGGILNFIPGALPLTNISFGGGTLQWAAGNTQDVSAAMAPIAAGQAANIDTNGNAVTFAANLSGSGGLTKLGAGSLTLLGSNTYSGNTTISAGTLQIDDGGASGTLGSGNVVNASVLVFDRSDSYTVNNAISGAGALYQVGSGTLTLSGSNSGLGPVTVSGVGALTISGTTSTGTTGPITVGANTGNTAVLNLVPGSVLNANATAAPSFVAATASGGTGTINISGGTLNTTSELWLSSVGGAYGIMNMSGGVANIGSWLAVGRGGNNGSLNVSGGSLTVLGNNLTIASFAGNQGQVAVSGGTVHAVNSIYVGEGGAGTMTLSGSGVVSATSLFVGQAGGSAGTYAQSGGLLTASGNVYNATNGVGIVVGSLAGSSGTLNISGGTISGTAPVQVWSGSGSITVSQTGSTPTLVNAAWITLGQNSGANGTFTQNGGAITTTGNPLYLGFGGGATGSYNLHGGSLMVTDIRTDSGTGTMYQDGGSATANGWLRLGIYAGSNSSYNLAGGSLAVSGAEANVGEAGTGSLTIGGSNGGTMVVAATSTLTIANGAGSGTLNLQNGGLLRTPTILSGSGTSTFNWTGGTLQNAPNGNLAVSVPVNLNGPGTLAVDNGQAAALSAAIGGTGSLTKAGSGLLVLSANNAYQGLTLIGGGTLQLSTASIFSPVAQYSFSLAGSGSTTVANLGSGGAAMNGTLQSGASIVSGGRNGQDALQLTGGNNSYVNVPSAIVDLSSSANWTVTGWMQTSTAGATLFYKGSGGWASGNDTFYLTNGNANTGGTYVGAVRYGGGWIAGSTPVNDGIWHFVAITDAGGTQTVYTDGVANPTVQWAVHADAGTEVWIGRSADTGDGVAGFSGLIDSLSFYSSTLSQANIQTLMSGGNLPVNILPAGTPVQIAPGSTLDLNGVNQTVASLSDVAGAGGTVTSSATGSVTLTLSPSSATTFSGTIQNGNGIVSLVVNGLGTQVLAGSNTYSGVTTVGGGVLSVGILANGGAASGIGASTNAAANLVIDGGTLQYTGGGATTDHLLTIGVATGNATIDASGSGPLVWSNTSSVATVVNTVPNTITLTGSSTANNSFAPSIQDPPNFNTSLIKNGPGTWVLTGQSQYSGPTMVNAGKLVLAAGSSLDETAITVAPGATFAPQASSGTISTTSYAQIPGGAALTLQNGSIFDMSDNAVGCFNLTQYSALNSTSLALGGATLKFDLSGTGADELRASWGTASVSGTNTISIVEVSGLTSLASSASYPLIQIPGGGLNSGGSFALSSGTIQAGGNIYDLSLTTASGGTAELLNVLLASAGTPVSWATTNSGSGSFSWGGSGNWSNQQVPTSGTLSFAGSPGTPITITLDGARSAGALMFNVSGSNDYTLAQGSGGTLTLGTSSSAPSISVLSGSHTISAPLEISGGGLDVVLSASGALGISGNVSDDGGNRSLTLNGDGSGRLILSGSNTYSGGTYVEAGALIAAASGAIPHGSSLTVGAGATLILDSASAGGPIASPIEASSAGVVAVPEPGTLALLLAGLVIGFTAVHQCLARKKLK